MNACPFDNLYELTFYFTDRSDISRFNQPGRTPKPEKAWSDRARRRLWVRGMCKGGRGRTTSAAILFSEAAPKVQSGLRSIHLVRLKIEEIMLNELDAASAEDLSQLVSSVRANIDHICKLLDVAEQSGVSAKEAIVINKLRNDIAKEEVREITCCVRV
jgi:hypothetical protein